MRNVPSEYDALMLRLIKLAQRMNDLQFKVKGEKTFYAHLKPLEDEYRRLFKELFDKMNAQKQELEIAEIFWRHKGNGEWYDIKRTAVESKYVPKAIRDYVAEVIRKEEAEEAAIRRRIGY